MCLFIHDEWLNEIINDITFICFNQIRCSSEEITGQRMI